jgi:RNA polymerase sigma-70 factor (ECF subfamily)
VAGVVIDEFPGVLRAAQAGEEPAIAELWRALNHRVVRFLSARAPGAAEDLASETWLTVARNLHTFSGNEIEFRAWIFTIARSRLIDSQRRRRRRPDEVDNPTALAGHLSPCNTARDALDAIDTEAAVAVVGSLPPDQADVILLRVLAGLDVARVAAIMGKEPGAVRTLQHRGLRRLREMLTAAAEDSEAPESDEQGVTR